MTLIEELHQARLGKKMSIRKASELIGIDHSHLVKIEKGKCNPNIDTILKMVEVYGLRLILQENK